MDGLGKFLYIEKKIALRGRLGGQLGTLQGSIWRTNKGLEGLGGGYWSLNRDL